MSDRIDRLPCVGVDPLAHRCGVSCLPIVARGLKPVSGWRWCYGSLGGKSWGLWLEKIGGAGVRWWPLDLPAANSARELVAIIHAYSLGVGGGVIE